MRGVNDDETGAPPRVRPRVGAEVRFIEYMDVGGATHWSTGHASCRAPEMLARARRASTARSTPIDEDGCGAGRPLPPARRHGLRHHRVDDATRSARTCDRSRLTADGMWYLCLYAHGGVDLRAPLRARRGAGRARRARSPSLAGADATAAPRSGWPRRAPRRSSPVRRCARIPHLEMHTRGG